VQAANVLNSPRAVEMSIYVVRAFVQLRELLTSNRELAQRLDELEARIEKKLTGLDQAMAAMLSAIRELMKPAPGLQRGIGFTADRECRGSCLQPRCCSGGVASGVYADDDIEADVQKETLAMPSSRKTAMARAHRLSPSGYFQASLSGDSVLSIISTNSAQLQHVDQGRPSK
jgi:hypothetical protein